MKISFDLEESDLSGKHKFISRLKQELIKLQYTVVNSSEKADIHLFIKNPSKYAKKNIYRLDGIWINEDQDYKSMNKKIVDKIKSSNGVIYQNEFCKEAVNRILKINPINYACILNGVNQEEFTRSSFVNNNDYFLAMCKWRPHKRLHSIIDGFLAANLKDVDLLILGEADCQIKYNNIKYLGWQKKEDTNSILCNKKCISTIHLAWLDWCPNSVVESLVAGKQVLHTDSGGTPFVVKGRGYVIEDKKWEFNIHDLYNPPKLDIEELAYLYQKTHLSPIVKFDNADLLISNIAKLYSDFFIKTIEGR